MTMIGDEHEEELMEWIIDQLPTEFTYDDLEPIRKGNRFITGDEIKE
jgi:hypothetical protein